MGVVALRYGVANGVPQLLITWTSFWLVVELLFYYNSGTIALLFLQTGACLSDAMESYAESHDKDHFLLNMEQLRVIFNMVCITTSLLYIRYCNIIS